MNDIEKIVSARHLHLALHSKPLEQVGAEERELLRACRERTVRCCSIGCNPRLARSIFRKQRIPGNLFSARQSYRSS